MAEVPNLCALNQPSIQEKQESEQQHLHTQTLHSGSVGSDINNGGNSVDSEDVDFDDFGFDPLSSSPHNISSLSPLFSNSSFRGSSPKVDSESERSDLDHSDSAPVLDYPDGEEEEDQVIFVTNLFESRGVHVLDDSNSICDILDSTYDGITDGVFGVGVSINPNELGLESGLGFFAEPLFTEYSGTRGVEMESSTASPGLRVAGIDFDSDSEVAGANSEIADDVDDDDDGIDGNGDLNLSIFWDCLPFNDWEEVDGRDGDGEGLSLVTDRMDEISVSSDTSLSQENSGDVEEEAVRHLEWEVLLAVNNLDLERNFEFENDGVDDNISHLALHDDFVYGAEYDTLFGQLMETESALKGSPPAAKLVVENLPSVVLTKEDVKENDVVCAVCKDEIMVEEMVTRLPCQHHYHGTCIVPWLSIRNTCPVCRYELPTDDANYEQQKIGRDPRDGHGVLDGLQYEKWRIILSWRRGEDKIINTPSTLGKSQNNG